MVSFEHLPTHHFNYAAALDPWLRHRHSDVESLLKLACLTSKHVVISDNQALNNKGLQRLLKRPDVANFLSMSERDGLLPVVISLRRGVRDFEDMLAKLLLEREIPPIFPWMSARKQQSVEAAYSAGNAKTVGPFLDIAGKEFIAHIERLNQFLEAGNSPIVYWEGLEENYPSLVQAAIVRFISSVAQGGSSPTTKNMVLDTCDRMLAHIDKGIQVNRSNLFRVIAASNLDAGLQRTLTLKLLDEPYHVNFSRTGGFHMAVGPEYYHTSLNEVLSNIALSVQNLRPEDVIEINEFPLLLSQIPFSRIQRIRNTYSFQSLVGTIADGPPETRTYALRDLLDLISAELSYEPRGVHKLTKLRLSIFTTPTILQDRLAEAGISFGDMLGFAGRAGGFLTGETVGQMVGVFGVGGLIGTSAAVVVEQFSNRMLIKPRKRREFQYAIQLLTAR